MDDELPKIELEVVKLEPKTYNLDGWTIQTSMSPTTQVDEDFLHDMYKGVLGIGNLPDPKDGTDLFSTPYVVNKDNDKISILMYTGYSDTWKKDVVKKIKSIGVKVVKDDTEKFPNIDALMITMPDEEAFSVFKFYFWNYREAKKQD